VGGGGPGTGGKPGPRAGRGCPRGGRRVLRGGGGPSREKGGPFFRGAARGGRPRAVGGGGGAGGGPPPPTPPPMSEKEERGGRHLSAKFSGGEGRNGGGITFSRGRAGGPFQGGAVGGLNSKSEKKGGHGVVPRGHARLRDRGGGGRFGGGIRPGPPRGRRGPGQPRQSQGGAGGIFPAFPRRRGAAKPGGGLLGPFFPLGGGPGG